MSKIISFSISDRYLDKLRTLYPSLTDNLAAKQFLTDGLESSLGNSLDGNLDAGLDGKLKSLIESELDGLLDERLDASVGKLISDLSERMARLEKRLDTKLDGGLDEMKLLLRMQREASITSFIPTGETVEDAMDTVETADTVEDATKKDESVDESVSTVEPVTGPIGPVPGETDSIEPVTGEGMNPNQAHEYLISKGIEDIRYYYLNKWAKAGVIETPQGKNALKYLKLINKLYYPIN